MPFLDVLRSKRRRIEGEEPTPAIPRRIEGSEEPTPVIPRTVEDVVVVDVDDEPVATSPSQVPPTGAEMPSPPRTAASQKGKGQGKDSLGPGVVPLVIFPEVPDDVIDENHQELVRYFEARALEGEETRKLIGEYLAEVPPAEDKGKACRADLEPFFRGWVGERYVPLLTELAHGMLKGMLDIQAKNIARNGTDNEITLASAARLSALRVSIASFLFIILMYFDWSSLIFFVCRLPLSASAFMTLPSTSRWIFSRPEPEWGSWRSLRCLWRFTLSSRRSLTTLSLGCGSLRSTWSPRSPRCPISRIP